MTSRRSFLQASLLMGGFVALKNAASAELAAHPDHGRLRLLISDGPLSTVAGGRLASTIIQGAGKSVKIKCLGTPEFRQLCAEFGSFEGISAIVVDEQHAWLVNEAMRHSGASLLSHGIHFARRADGSGVSRHHFQNLPASAGIADEMAEAGSQWPDRLGTLLSRIANGQPSLATTTSPFAGDTLASSDAEFRLASYIIELKGKSQC